MCAFARIYPLLISKFLSILKEASTKYVVLSLSIMEIEVSVVLDVVEQQFFLECVMQLYAVWQILKTNLSSECVSLIFKCSHQQQYLHSSPCSGIFLV